MKCADDITLYNGITKKITFINSLPELMIPLTKIGGIYWIKIPTIESAYAQIRREIFRQGMMKGDSSLGNKPSEIEVGFAIRGRSEYSKPRRDDKANLKCTFRGESRHTKEGASK